MVATAAGGDSGGNSGSGSNSGGGDSGSNSGGGHSGVASGEGSGYSGGGNHELRGILKDQKHKKRIPALSTLERVWGLGHFGVPFLELIRILEYNFF